MDSNLIIALLFIASIFVIFTHIMINRLNKIQRRLENVRNEINEMDEMVRRLNQIERLLDASIEGLNNVEQQLQIPVENDMPFEKSISLNDPVEFFNAKREEPVKTE